MTVTTNNATSTQSAGTGASPTVSSNGDISSMFTTLLVAQIKNQDPLNPTDSSQYVTQLAQLSQVQSLATLTTQGSANAADRPFQKLVSPLPADIRGGMIPNHAT